MDQSKPPSCCMTFKSVVKFLSFCLLFVWPSLPEAIEGLPLISCYWKTEFIITYPNGTSVCKTCPKCAVGHELSITCGDTVSVHTSIDCRPCEANKYSNTIDSSMCKQCDDCRPGFNVTKECNRTQNRECAPCKPNHYFDDTVDPPECRECFFCCPHVNDSEKLKQCKNMPRNQQCEKNDKNEQCKLFATTESTTPVSTPTTDATAPTSTTRPVMTTHHETTKENTKRNSAQSSDNNVKVMAVIVTAVVVVVIAIVLGVCLIYRYNNNDISDEDLEIPVGKQGSPLSTISFDVEEELKNKLDVIRNGEKGWRKLGIALEIVPADLDCIDLAYMRPGGSPTEELLEKLKTLETTVDELINALKDPRVNRRDVARLVIQGFETERNSESSSVI